jgi:hypothetical protein
MLSEWKLDLHSHANMPGQSALRTVNDFPHNLFWKNYFDWSTNGENVEGSKNLHYRRTLNTKANELVESGK